MFDKKNTINQSGQNNLAIQNSEVHVIVSIFDEIEHLAKQGKHKEVANLIKKIKDFVGTKHPFYPHYRYKPVQIGNTTVLEHEALTADAGEKYPLTYRGQFSVSNKKLEGFNNIYELIEDAFFKQEEIEINMSSLTTWIGEQPVETPNLEESFKDGEWVIVPNPLPNPLQLKLYIKGNPDISLIDYLEMSISGKGGKDLIIIDNTRQKNAKLLVSLKLPFNQVKEYDKISNAKINVKINPNFQSNVEANRNLLHLFKLVTDGNKTIAFKNLKEDNDFIVVSRFSFEGDTGDLDKDFNFIERLYKIENHYNLSFTIPEKIDKSDFESIEILEHAMVNKPLKKNLQELTVDFTDKTTLLNLIELFDSVENVKKLMIEQSGPKARVELFDEVIPIEKVQTVYNSLRVEDLERLKRKLELMDEGESIKVILIPGEDPEFYEQYYFKNSK